MNPPRKGKLPRLEKQRYQGHAVVFWTNTLEERARGWLTPTFHATFRELMLHAAARKQLFCPAYCLMPDHLHLVWMGMRRESDQLNAMKFLRTHLEPALGGGCEWQHQPHDHVLREEERKRNAFSSFCFYTLANPVRAGLVAAPAAEVAAEVTRRTGEAPEESASLRRRLPSEWPYCGAVIPAIRRFIHRRKITGSISGNSTSPPAKPNRQPPRSRSLVAADVRRRIPFALYRPPFPLLTSGATPNCSELHSLEKSQQPKPPRLVSQK